MKPDDLDEPLRLLEDFFRDGVAVPGDFRRKLREAMKRGDIEAVTAFADGVAVGVLTLTFRSSVSLGGEFASIEDFYVDPEHRRRGVGRAMLDEAERICRRRDVSYLEAQVEEDAAPFYEASGFGEEDVRVMSRSLMLG